MKGGKGEKGMEERAQKKKGGKALNEGRSRIKKIDLITVRIRN